jgi:hypothetical protein
LDAIAGLGIEQQAWRHLGQGLPFTMSPESAISVLMMSPTSMILPAQLSRSGLYFVLAGGIQDRDRLSPAGQ